MINNAKELLDYTIRQLRSILFHYEYRTSPEYFSRKSILGFENTAVMILQMVKKSIKVELMNYFYQLDKELEIPSRQAFSEARNKISCLAIKDFFEKSCELAVTGNGARLYKGYRLFAVNGTSFVVGMLEKLSEHFGESTTVTGRT